MSTPSAKIKHCLIWICIKFVVDWASCNKIFFNGFIYMWLYFLTAAALYYLAELVEEYTSTAAKVLRYSIWVGQDNSLISYSVQFTVYILICGHE